VNKRILSVARTTLALRENCKDCNAHLMQPPVETDRRRLRTIAFVINRRGYAYAGRLTPEQTADILATACGHGGSCAEYLYNTASHLEERGIRDRNL
jgi:cation transport regulator ChaC